MAGFVEGVDRSQRTLFPASLENYITEDNPVRAVDAFVDGLDLRALGFTSVDPLETGRSGYHPAMMLKLYVYGYLNRVPSSRRLETRVPAQSRADLAHGQACPRFQNHR
jgi:transposase